MGNCSKPSLKTPRLQSTASAILDIRQVYSESQHSQPSPRDSSEIFDPKAAIVNIRDKTPLETQELLLACKSSSMLRSISESNLLVIIARMQLYLLQPFVTVVLQGQQGTTAYLVASGKLEVRVDDQYIGILSRDESFGASAMYTGVYSESVRTLNSVKRWGLDRKSYQEILKDESVMHRAQKLKFLENSRLFDSFSRQMKEDFLDLALFQEYSPGQMILDDSASERCFLIVVSGDIVAMNERLYMRKLGPGEVFGAQYLQNSSQKCNCFRALGPVSVFWASEETCGPALGESFYNLLYRNSVVFAVQQSRILSSLNKRQITEVAGLAHYKSYKQGAVVARPDSQKLIILLSGRLKYHQKTAKGLQILGEPQPNLADQFLFSSEVLADEYAEVAEIHLQDLESQLGGDVHRVCLLNKTIRMLENLYIFKSLSHQDIESLASILKLQQFDQGDYIFKENEPGSAFYIIQSGTADVIKDGEVIRRISKHGWFGEQAVIYNTHRTACVLARTPLKIWSLNRNHFLDFLNQDIKVQMASYCCLQYQKLDKRRLRVVKRLSHQSTSEVYLTVLPESEFKYAARVITRSLIVQQNLMPKLEREREFLLACHHPFIMKFAGAAQDGGHLYLFTEYLHQSFASVLESLGQLQTEQTRFYAGCFAVIAEYLHERDIIHRELTPQSFMIDLKGYPILYKCRHSVVRDGRTLSLVGVADYSSPEAIAGQSLTSKNDIWSLGVMVFEMLTGTPPFEGASPTEVYQNILRKRLKVPGFLKSDRIVGNLIESLLEKNPSQRIGASSLVHHPWFDGMDWNRLLGKLLHAPLVPPSRDLKFEVSKTVFSGRPLSELMKKTKKQDYSYDEAWERFCRSQVIRTY